MSVKYPVELDAFTNPTKFDNTSDASREHGAQHANANDAIEALEAKVGVDNSEITTSLDYKVNHASGLVSGKVSKAGDTMTGFLVLHADPDANLKAATKQYVDTMLPKAGGTMTGFITLHADPDAAMKAATKQYVDARGYTFILCGHPLGFSPADSTTYYAGLISPELSTTYAHVSLKIPKTGTVKRIELKVRVRGTLGSNETVSHYLRLNDTTDFGQIDTTYDAVNRELTLSGLSQAVTAGDTLALKIVAPAWATNPVNVQVQATVWIEA